jgi:hypothetical protein
MQRALVITAAATVLTALAVSTAGCGNSSAAGNQPPVHRPASARPSAPAKPGARDAELYGKVLRRYLSTPAENLFPGGPFKTVFVLDRAYPEAAGPDGSDWPGVPIAPQIQRQVTAALAGMEHVIFIPARRSVGKARPCYAHVNNGRILITLGPPTAYGNDVHVAINGFIACVGRSWLTYILHDQPGVGWRVKSTTGAGMGAID